jgi:MHS family proline/betaine transporter-like MFS transporter
VQGLIKVTGDDMAPAYYLMATSVIGAVAVFFLRESARRPLPGSMPSVDTEAEAHELVASQDHNPLLDLDDMPFEKRTEASVQ